MSTIVGILLLIGFTAFAIYQIVSIIRNIKTKKANNEKDKEVK